MTTAAEKKEIDLAAKRKTEAKVKAGKRTQELKKMDMELEGVVSVADAGRAIECDRKEVLRLVTIGSLEQVSDGPFVGAISVDSLHAYLEAQAGRKVDPAVEHLKEGFRLQIQHNQRMMDLSLGSSERMLSSYERRVARLESQQEKLFDQQITNMKLHRELADGQHERKLELLREEQTEARLGKGITMLETHLPAMLGMDEAVEALKESGSKLFSSFSAEQAAKLIDIMTPEQVKLFGKVAAAMEGDTDDAPAEQH